MEICILEFRGEHIMKLLNCRPLFSRTEVKERKLRAGRGKWEAANINGVKERT